jgi:hypothetical protein
MSYPEFLQNLTDPVFSYHLAPLRILLEGLGENERRWNRLVATHEALLRLKRHCELLLDPEKANRDET